MKLDTKYMEMETTRRVSGEAVRIKTWINKELMVKQ